MGELKLNYMVLVIALVLLFVFIGDGVVYADMSWATVKMNSGYPEGKEPKAEEFEKVLKATKPNSVLVGHCDKIIQVANANGLNAYLFFAKLMYESAWGTSGYARNHYNFGGMDCTSRRKKDPANISCTRLNNGRNITTFKTIDVGLKVNAELLKENYVGEGRVTLKQILDKYAPVSDNNDHKSYLDGYRTITAKLGMTKADFENTGELTGSETYSDGGEVGEHLEEYLSIVDESGGTGLRLKGDESDVFSSYRLYRLTRKVLHVINKIIGYVLILALVYMLIVTSIFVLAYASHLPSINSLLGRMTGGRLDVNQAGSVLEIAKLVIVVSIVFALVLSNAVQYLISYIFYSIVGAIV